MERKVRILVLSFYYPPDLSAGSFRVSSLLEAFKKNKDPSLTIDVITTQPNRYANLACPTETVEGCSGVQVQRISLPPHNSGMKDQARSFAVYAKNVRRLTKGKQWDLVFATSSRLMTAALGAYISRKQRVPLYLDIRDLFHDTIGDVLGGSQLKHILPIFKKLENWTFQSAAQINVVSEGFLADLAQIAPNMTPSTFTNGIDNLFLETDFQKKTKDPNSVPTLLYAGNIGEGQGLHRIIPLFAKKFVGELQVKIVGDGGRATQLKAALREYEISNDAVQLAPPVPRHKLLELYKDADMLFLHLNDYDAFRKVLPSKIFEYAATGKPIIAGVDGYSAEFLKSEVPAAMVFDCCDVDGMIRAVNDGLNVPKHVERSEFLKKYSRDAIMSNMCKDILQTVEQ